MWNRFVHYLASHWVLAKGLIVGTGFVLGLGVLLLRATIGARMRSRKRGYRVRYIGRGNYIYEERVPATASEVQSIWYKLRMSPSQIAFGRCQQLPFHGEPLDGSVEPQLPGEERWNDQVPSWAQGRRKEILHRIAECFRVPEEEASGGRTKP